MEDKEHINIKNSATILLLSVANADYNIEKEEIKVRLLRNLYLLNHL